MTLSLALRERFVRWALRVRAPEPAPVVLTRERVYVLPTKAGLAYAAALLIMLAGSINYALGLGHALTFLLAGLGIVGILHTWRNLFSLKLSPGRTPAVFAGERAAFPLVVEGGAAERRAVRLRLGSGEEATIDIPAGERVTATLRLDTVRRGWLPLPRLALETTWPLGLVRAFSWCEPEGRCLVYPRPAADAPPLPWRRCQESGQHAGGGRGRDDFAGFRDHQPADPPRHVAWKVAARLGEDAPLQTKLFEGASAARQLWLDWDALPGRDEETRLSILARWVLEAHASGCEWGLRLPGATLAPGSGQQHADKALEMLALHGLS